MTKEKPIRVNFQLPKSLSDKFASEAAKQGITKAQLLRKWIDSTSSLVLQKYERRAVKKVSFHFFVDEHLLNTIKVLENEFNLSRSQLLRLIIDNKISSHFVYQDSDKNITNKLVLPVSHSYITKLWNEGRLGEISCLLSKDIEKLPTNEIYMLTRINVELSNYKRISSMIDILKKRKDVSTLDINVLEAEVALNKRDLIKAENIIESIIASNCSNYGVLRANTSRISAVIAALKETNTKLEIYKFHNALSLSKYCKDECNKLKVLLQMILTESRIMKYSSARNRLIIYKRNFNLSQNIHNFGLYNVGMALLLSLTENQLPIAKKYLETGIFMHKINGYSKGLVESIGTYAFIKIIENDYPMAMKYIMESKRYEGEFRTPNSDGLTEFGRLFLISKDNYYDSTCKMKRELADPSSIIKLSSKRYLLYTAQYLHGPNEQERQKGEQNLYHLSQSGSYPQIRSAALKTLERKSFQMFTV